MGALILVHGLLERLLACPSPIRIALPTCGNQRSGRTGHEASDLQFVSQGVSRGEWICL